MVSLDMKALQTLTYEWDDDRPITWEECLKLKSSHGELPGDWEIPSTFQLERAFKDGVQGFLPVNYLTRSSGTSVPTLFVDMSMGKAYYQNREVGNFRVRMVRLLPVS